MSDNAAFRACVITQMRRALDFRLLLFWLIASVLPTLLVALPMSEILSEVLDFSAYSEALAQRLDLDALRALGNAYQHSELAIQANVTLAWVCTLLFAPMLTAMAAAIFSTAENLTSRALLLKALMDYGRWFWLHLSAFLVYLFGFGTAALVAASPEIRVGEYVDANAFANMRVLSWLLAALIALTTHFIVEITRAEYVLDLRLRFPPNALFRALARKQLLRRMLAYLIVCGAGVSVLLLLVLLRQRMTGASLVAMLCTLILTQLGVAALAWTRTARLFVLAALVKQTSIAPAPVDRVPSYAVFDPTRAAFDPAPVDKNSLSTRYHSQT